jgi:hypothetical protein
MSFEEMSFDKNVYLQHSREVIMATQNKLGSSY